MLFCLGFSSVEVQITEEPYGGEVTDFLFYLIANERNYVPTYWQVRYRRRALACFHYIASK